MRKYIIPLMAIAVVGGGVAFWFLRRSGGEVVAFRTETLDRGELLATVGGTGTLEPEDVIDVGSQVAGLIKEFGVGTDGKPIDYGSPVNSGTILARIDDQLFAAKAEQSRALLRSAEQKVAQAKAKVDQAVANTKKARADLKQSVARSNQSTRDYTRLKNLKTSGSVSDTEYDAARSAFEINEAGIVVSEAAIVQNEAAEADARAAVADAEAAVATAKAGVLQDEINLGYCTIKANVTGTILDRRVTIGQTVQASFNTPSLFLIAKDLKRMKVWASVNESDIGQIRVNQPVRFAVDAYPGETFRGAVNRIRLNATNTQNVVVYTVEVMTDNTTGKLLPYMTANLSFEVDRRTDTLLVSNAALRYRPAAALIASSDTPSAKDAAGEKQKPGQGVVWVQEGTKLRAVPITTGLTDGTMTEILSGDLAPGADVVVGEAQSGSSAATAQNPFAPKLGGSRR